MGEESGIITRKYAKMPALKIVNGRIAEVGNYFKKSNNELVVGDI